jgi:hypothetical protein
MPRRRLTRRQLALARARGSRLAGQRQRQAYDAALYQACRARMRGDAMAYAQHASEASFASGESMTSVHDAVWSRCPAPHVRRAHPPAVSWSPVVAMQPPVVQLAPAPPTSQPYPVPFVVGVQPSVLDSPPTTATASPAPSGRARGLPVPSLDAGVTQAEAPRSTGFDLQRAMAPKRVRGGTPARMREHRRRQDAERAKPLTRRREHTDGNELKGMNAMDSNLIGFAGTDEARRMPWVTQANSRIPFYTQAIGTTDYYTQPPPPVGYPNASGLPQYSGYGQSDEPEAPETALGSVASVVGWAGSVVGTVAGAYHGYKRNDSVGWGIGWALLGGLFWPIVLPISYAQGFGERKR